MLTNIVLHGLDNIAVIIITMKVWPVAIGAVAEIGGLDRLTEWYYRVRYGRRTPGAQTRRELTALARAIGGPANPGS